MRNPDRIDPFLAELGEIWHRHPDMRFGQLMSNILGEVASKHGDIFFPEDNKMLEYFKEIDWL